MHLLYESLVRQCEYTAQPKRFGVMLLIQMGVVLLLIFINIFLPVLYLSLSFRYVVELKLLHNLKNEAAWAYNNIIYRLIRYCKLSCIEFYSCNLQQ